MITRILVPLDGSEYAEFATLQACQIAKLCDAEVVGVAIIDLDGINNQLASAAVVHAVTPKNYHVLLEAAKNEAAQCIQTVLDGFCAVCTREHVRHSKLKEEGSPATWIVEFSAGVDLIVMGLRTHFRHPLGSHTDNTLIEVLEQAVVPVLAISRQAFDWPQNVLLAYDGSHQATQAMRALVALNATRPFDHTYIVTSDQDVQHREFLLQQAAAYFRSHQVNHFTLKGTDKDITDVVHQDYLETVDLVALGVHAKHSLKEFFLGGLTKSLIEGEHGPLLLAQ